jgi:hypothetical protein
VDPIVVDGRGLIFTETQLGFIYSKTASPLSIAQEFISQFEEAVAIAKPSEVESLMPVLDSPRLIFDKGKQPCYTIQRTIQGVFK